MDILLVLIVVLIVVFIWRGPAMLPRIGEAMGRTVKGVRENLPGANDAARDEEAPDKRDSGPQSGV